MAAKAPPAKTQLIVCLGKEERKKCSKKFVERIRNQEWMNRKHTLMMTSLERRESASLSLVNVKTTVNRDDDELARHRGSTHRQWLCSTCSEASHCGSCGERKVNQPREKSASACTCDDYECCPLVAVSFVNSKSRNLIELNYIHSFHPLVGVPHYRHDRDDCGWLTSEKFSLTSHTQFFAALSSTVDGVDGERQFKCRMLTFRYSIVRWESDRCGVWGK